jgi:hypothetical protein
VKLAKGGAADTQAKLLKLIKKESTPSAPNGSSFRWVVAAAETGELQLQLQVIPLPAASINAAPILRADNIAAKTLQHWNIRMTCFDGVAGLNGPVPILFTEQPEELRSKLLADPNDFMLQLNKIMKW